MARSSRSDGVSPIGGPVPAAGWQAMLLLFLGWFTAAWWRAGRRSAYVRHGSMVPG